MAKKIINWYEINKRDLPWRKRNNQNFYKIWISSNKLSDDELVGTILHESLHYLVTFNGNDICEKDEHQVMAKLGDDC